jgi:hypothetical protein
MKKIILFFIIIINLYANDVVSHKQDNNVSSIIDDILINPTTKIIEDLNISERIITPTHKTIVGYKKDIIDTVNYFTPNFLQISKETSSVKLKIYFDTLKQKNVKYSLNAHLKLPEFFLTKKKTKPKKIKNQETVQTNIFNIKIRPIFKFKPERFFFFQNIIEYKTLFLNNKIGVANKINYYPFDNYYEESITFAYFITLKKTYSTSLNISTNKDVLPTKYYSLNFSVSKLQNQLIGSYGYTLGGSTDKNPFIYYHKIFLNIRKSLFHKKYLFVDIMPYILISKDYNFKIETALYSSLNVEF